MLLEEILERNREYIRGREARPLPPPEALRLAVVACFDPRLDSMILPALGLAPGEALVVRTAGAVLGSDGGDLRSLALGVFLFGVTEVVVLGHTSCRISRFDTASFIEAFRGRGVPRDAFGPGDLREWAGATPDPRRGVSWTVRAIREAPFLPRDLAVSGLLLDDARGAVEVVVRQDEEEAAAAIASPAPHAAAPDVSLRAPEPTGAEPPREAAEASPATPPALAEAAELFSRVLRTRKRWDEQTRRLREDVARHRDPSPRARLLESFARSVAAESRELGQAFERLKREALRARGRLDADEILELVLRREREP